MTNIRNHQPVNIPAIKILDVVRPTTHCSCGSRLQSDSNFLCLCLLPKHFGWSQKYDHWFNWFSTIVEVEQFPWRFVSLPLLFQVPVNIKHFWNHQLCSHWLQKLLRLRVYLEGFAHIAIALMMIQSSFDWAWYIMIELWSHALMDDLSPDLKLPTIFVSQKTRTPLEKPCSQARCCPEIRNQTWKLGANMFG